MFCHYLNVMRDGFNWLLASVQRRISLLCPISLCLACEFGHEHKSKCSSQTISEDHSPAKFSPFFGWFPKLKHYVISIIMYIKKILDFDWLRAVQCKFNTSAKIVTRGFIKARAPGKLISCKDSFAQLLLASLQL